MTNKKKGIPVTISLGAEQIYITGAFGGFTPYDFRIALYNETMEPKGQTTDDIILARESRYELIMSPLTAKELLNWLDKNVRAYEEEYGKIKLPKVKKPEKE